MEQLNFTSQCCVLYIVYLYTVYMCGLGVVRSVSAEDKAIYILTPVAPSVLENVNCIQCGAISIPKYLRITSEVKSSSDSNQLMAVQKFEPVHFCQKVMLQTLIILPLAALRDSPKLGIYTTVSSCTC